MLINITPNFIRSSAPAVAPDPPAGQQTVTGSGFGSGPTVVLFDRFEGTHGANIDLAGAAISGADWGDSDSTLASGMGSQTRYWSENGRTWMTCRDSSDIASSAHNGAGLYYDHPTANEEFFVSYRMMIPDTYKYPGATNANQLTPLSDNTSRWKQFWLSNRSGRYTTNDMVLGTAVSTGLGVGGNTFLPRYWNGSSYVDTSLSYSGQTAVGENLISMYISGAESSGGAHDATYETVQHKDGDYDRRLYQGTADPYYHTSGTPTETINSFSFNGWSGNVSNWSNMMMLMTDAYMAVGANAGARIYTHDQPTLAGSSLIYIIPPDSWSDTEIKYTPKSYENLTYVSIVQSDLTIQENV